MSEPNWTGMNPTLTLADITLDIFQPVTTRIFHCNRVGSADEPGDAYLHEPVATHQWAVDEAVDAQRGHAIVPPLLSPGRAEVHPRHPGPRLRPLGL